MGINIADNFSYLGGKPLDGRIQYSTLAAMKAMADAALYEGCEAYCIETDKYYQWKSSNTVDASTGKWRERTGGGGGSAIKLADVLNPTVTVNDNTATLKWTDPDDIIVSRSVLAAWSGTAVVRKVGSAPASMTDGTLVIDSKTKNQYSSSGYADTGLAYGTTYYYRWFPYTDEGVVTDGSYETASVAMIKIPTVPSQSGSLTYNGTAQTPTWSDYDPTKMTLIVTAETNAGTYTAEFTPKPGYCWNDDTTTAKTVSWNIDKATGAVSVVPSSIELNASQLYEDITITQTGDGVLSVTSSDTSVATVGTITNNVFRITCVNPGNCTVTVTAAASTNYTAANATVSVTDLSVDSILNNNSWSVISSVSAMGEGSSYWNVGDTKEVILNGTVGTLQLSNQSLWVYILGFDHNSALEGSGISFGCFKDAQTNGKAVCLVDSEYDRMKKDGTKVFNMNHWGYNSSPYNTNYGGWEGCDMRYDILGSTNTAPSGYGAAPTADRVGYDAGSTTATNPVSNTFMSALPSDLRAVMKPITKYTDNKGNKSTAAANVTASVDYLPLLAEFEVQGKRTYANNNEKTSQAQYAYYANGNSKAKVRFNDTTRGADDLYRSPDVNYANTFVGAYGDGSVTYIDSSESQGLSPVFLV